MLMNYSKLPSHMQEGARDYVENGVPGGDFLHYVFCNDLVHSFGKADNTNLRRMFDWASFLYNEAPMECWGSEEKVEAWVAGGGLQGLRTQKEEVEG